LTAAASPSQALSSLVDVIRKRLEPAGLELLDVETGEASAGPLARRGLELWSQRGSPRRGVVRLEARSEDPAPDRPELVVPLATLSGSVVLVVVSARWDGLPYTTDELRVFEALSEIATVALGHTATSAELERLVGQRTESLQRSLQDRAAVLDAARRIQAADEPRGVRLAVQRFLKSLAGDARWVPERPAEAANRLVAHLEGSGSSSYLVAEGFDANTTEEIGPQLETVCAFANLALGRLHLLDQLKQEVERQSREIANITARRQHAEFVRGVAHELRKPTEEVHQIGSSLAGMLDGALAAQAVRIARVTQEMNRRIDLLLFHSELRFDFRRIDLVRLIDDAIQRSQATNPDRKYQVDHALGRLPLVGDPSRLLSVIENLLDNALKATAEGGSVEVRSRLLAGDEGDKGNQGQAAGSWACIEVADAGIGIAPGELDAIFEPGVSHFREGFGLGLALCREVVRGHQGRIEVEARPGVTLFRVLVPQFMEREAGARP
jgi:signal transduction histidine kinase